jgi:hypothetical protein
MSLNPINYYKIINPDQNPAATAFSGEWRGDAAKGANNNCARLNVKSCIHDGRWVK